MEIEIRVEGDVVERTELLNGTVTIALEGESGDGTWTVSGVLSWNRGLVDFAGEGDLTISGADGDLFASLTSATVAGTLEDASDDDGQVVLQARYEVDGGLGNFEGASGSIEGQVIVEGARFGGTWHLRT
jgi:propanediol dehydratase large subunit